MKENYVDNILEILNDEKYKTQLQQDLFNFPNLKLENQIRNNLVHIYNKNYRVNDEDRAFGEHPRYGFKKGEKGKRIQVDFSVCENTDVKFTMELRYHYPLDYSSFSKFYKSFLNYFNGRVYNKKGDKVSAYLLIICDYDNYLLKKTEINGT